MAGSRAEQVVELIDHAVKKHGKKVKFLNFREAQERLNKNLLAGKPLRAADGTDSGVRLFDVDSDGYLDVIERNPDGTRRPARPAGSFPPGSVELDDQGRDAGLRFVDLDEDGQLDVVFSNDRGVWDLPL